MNEQGIDQSSETIVPLSSADSVDLPKDQACFAFVRVGTQIAYLYSCPSTSPVRSRMVYSSSSRGVVHRAETELDVKPVKRVRPSYLTNFVARYHGDGDTFQMSRSDDTPAADVGSVRGDRRLAARRGRPGAGASRQARHASVLAT